MTPRVPSAAEAIGPPSALAEQVLIALVRAAWWAARPSNAIVAAAGLSPSQYNVLRILGTAGPDGLSAVAIGARMVTQEPDLTRLLGALIRRGAVVRTPDPADARRTINRLTDDGRALLVDLDPQVTDTVQRTFRHVPPDRLQALLGLLLEIAPPSRA